MTARCQTVKTAAHLWTGCVCPVLDHSSFLTQKHQLHWILRWNHIFICEFVYLDIWTLRESICLPSVRKFCSFVFSLFRSFVRSSFIHSVCLSVCLSVFVRLFRPLTFSRHCNINKRFPAVEGKNWQRVLPIQQQVGLWFITIQRHCMVHDWSGSVLTDQSLEPVRLSLNNKALELRTRNCLPYPHWFTVLIYEIQVDAANWGSNNWFKSQCAVYQERA